MDFILKIFNVYLSYFKDLCDFLIWNLFIGVCCVFLMWYYKFSFVNYMWFKIENVDFLVIGNIYCKFNYFFLLGL